MGDSFLINDDPAARSHGKRLDHDDRGDGYYGMDQHGENRPWTSTPAQKSGVCARLQNFGSEKLAHHQKALAAQHYEPDLGHHDINRAYGYFL